MDVTRTRQVLGFSVPPSIKKEFERAAKKKRRTKSEMFREMWRVYQMYAKHIEQAEEERFEQMIREAMEEGIREKENPTKTQEEYDAEEERLLRYGAKQAKKAGIKLEDVDKIIYEERAKKRKIRS